jgi:MoaA/NifB/PqqE/SkfB family radical SAM enzyme
MLKFKIPNLFELHARDIPDDLSRVRHLGKPHENDKLASAEYRAGKTVLESLPPIVIYALTTYCFTKNICLICDRNTRDPRADTSATDSAIRAVTPLLKTATHVFLHSGGEAMYSKYFDHVISIIEPPTRATFATNGMAMTQKRTDLMLERDIMCEIMVSLDAATPEMLRVMRPACSFETISKNVAYYTQRTRTLGREEHSSLVLGMTVCEANLRDVPRLPELAVRLGAGFVEYNHLNVGLNHTVRTVDGWDWAYTEQAKFKDPALHDKLIQEAYRNAKALGIKMMFMGQPFIGPEKDAIDSAVKGEICDYSDTIFQHAVNDPWISPHHKPVAPGLPTCFAPWRQIVIQPTGLVRGCFFHDETKYSLGNIVDTDFMKMWNSEEMIREREGFLSRGASPTCFASHPCLYRGRQ